MARDRDTDAHAWLALSCRRDGTITRVLRDDYGITSDATSGARFADIVDVGSARKAEALIASISEHECAVGWQLNVPAGDGAQTLTFAGCASEETLLLIGAPGVGFSDAIGRDNHLYEELSRLNNELINREREVARKSAALERVSAERSRVVAIAAHDLRNPLTVIAAYADLLRMDNAVEGDHLLYVEEISRSAKFMMNLVEEMLDTSLLESGQIELDLHDVDLVAAARHAATINRVRADRKEISISFEPEGEHAVIRADPVRLRQILNNLTVNAIKFSPRHTHVAIRTRCDGDRHVFEIEDQGIGIPREKLTLIFEPFKTLGRSGTAGEASTGLGLAIVKQLAELHDATVHVESEIGRGSVFRVAFPAV